MRSIVALLALGVVAACGSASPTATTPASSSAPSTAPAAPGTSGPTTAPTSAGATDGATFSIPSYVPDTTLEAAFPDQIDGQPVTDVTASSYLGFLQEWGTPEDVDKFVAAMQSIGVNAASVSLGSANATVGGEEVQISALRVAGGSAASVFEKMIGLSPDDPPVMTAGNLGGKQVTFATDSDGDVAYYYFNGEYAWLLSMTDAQAAVVLAAVP